MNWFWLNIPLGAVMTLFAVGVPLWVTLKFPEEGAKTKRRAVVPEHRPAHVRTNAGPSASAAFISSRVIPSR
jgi:hypothetical protein